MRLQAFAVLSCLVLASAARSQALQATLFQGGFGAPIFVCSPPGDLQRVFVVEQGGRIAIVRNGATLGTAFINLGMGVGGLNKIVVGGEQGLLGLAFHPNYATNGFFYVNYSASGTGATVIERYHVSANPDVADGTSGLVLLTIPQPQANHNGGCLQFGPDGKLYIGMGDGGNANDQGPGHDPLVGNGQSPTTLLGKMLRLDVDIPAPYVPADNPYATSTTTLHEIWDFGMRNPWRFSFDSQTGDIYIGDVGQGAWEEVDFAAVGVGNLNYGWHCMEGNHCTGLGGCTCFAGSLTGAISEYDHGQGCAITGGYVYRGNTLCGMNGTYFFGDYCSSQIWSFKYVNGVVTNFTNRTTELEPAGTPTINLISSFGEDGAGELYICDIQDGEVYRIDLAGSQSDCNSNGLPDACDIAAGTAVDCNANGIPDTCDLTSGAAQDCNGNGIPDSCDIAAGTSLDVNQSGVPDECECPGGVPPTVFCVGKVNSQLCVPTIAVTGTPSASSTAPCLITADSFLNNKTGLLFYGYNTTMVPFQGGFFCSGPPRHRTPVQNSGGSPQGLNCTGTYSFDLNAWISSGADPVLQVAGQAISCQYWSRDPGDTFGSSLSNAVRANICQ
jgi:glucose/arabinose dehydrogenase